MAPPHTFEETVSDAAEATEDTLEVASSIMSDASSETSDAADETLEAPSVAMEEALSLAASLDERPAAIMLAALGPRLLEGSSYTWEEAEEARLSYAGVSEPMIASDADDAASVRESEREDSVPMTAELAIEEALEADLATLLVTLSTAGCSLPTTASEALLMTLSAEPVEEPMTASEAPEARLAAFSAAALVADAAASEAACAASAMLFSIARCARLETGGVFLVSKSSLASSAAIFHLPTAFSLASSFAAFSATVIPWCSTF